ncbi:hypothetical protein ACQY0O_004495 [Thecaphora frezii]
MSGPQRRQQMAHQQHQQHQQQQHQQHQQQQHQQHPHGPYHTAYGVAMPLNGYQASAGNGAPYAPIQPPYSVPLDGSFYPQPHQQSQPVFTGQPHYAQYLQTTPTLPHVAAYPAQACMFGSGQPQPYAAPTNPGMPSLRPPYRPPYYAGTAASGSSSASTPSANTPLIKPVQQFSLSTGHSPRPSAGATRLQAFVFPPAKPAAEASGTENPESTANAEAAAAAVDADGKLEGNERDAGQGSNVPATTSLPARPAFAPGPPGAPGAMGTGAYSFNPPFVPSSVSETSLRPMAATPQARLVSSPAAMQATDGLPGKKHDFLGQPAGHNGQRFFAPAAQLERAASGSASLRSDIALRYPVLPKLPAMPKPSTVPDAAVSLNKDGDQATAPASTDGDGSEELRAYKDYSEALESIVAVYQKREEILRLRTEAVGFEPKRAWLAWESGKGTEEADGVDDAGAEEAAVGWKGAEEATATHSILGVRLLQRVAKLSEENEELGRLLEAKLGLNDKPAALANWEAERAELFKELQEAHALIASLDQALTKAESRVSAAEKALEVACLNNSTAILPSRPNDGAAAAAASPPVPTSQPQPKDASAGVSTATRTTALPAASGAGVPAAGGRGRGGRKQGNPRPTEGGGRKSERGRGGGGGGGGDRGGRRGGPPPSSTAA